MTPAAALRAQAAVLLALADTLEQTSTSSAPSEFVTEQEAMALTGCRTKRALRDAARAAGLQAFGTTHRRMFKRADVVAFVEKRPVRVQAPPGLEDRLARRAERRLAR